MQKFVSLLIMTLLLIGCKNELVDTPQAVSEALPISYAKGFTIENFEDYKTITLTNPWPGADKTFTYCLIKEGKKLNEKISKEKFNAVIELPIETLVVTSTTHIPSLESLGVLDKLVGFPNLNYVSSEKARTSINQGKIRELGKNESINTEVLIELNPDLVVTFAVQGDNKTVSTIQKTGIPVIYNGDWTETHPLGKAEWIKFFGVLFNKEEKANLIFSEIESNYNTAKEIASKANTRPTVLSGAMYKDIWYLPQGDSWVAQFIEDAHGEYLWKDTKGTGSISLNLESVLEKGQNANYWIAPGQFANLNDMKESHSVYSEFAAFKNNKVHNFTNKKGATGGLFYYELGPNRPDLVLKDIIKILHPDLLPEYESFFFSQLK